MQSVVPAIERIACTTFALGGCYGGWRIASDLGSGVTAGPATGVSDPEAATMTLSDLDPVLLDVARTCCSREQRSSSIGKASGAALAPRRSANRPPSTPRVSTLSTP